MKKMSIIFLTSLVSAIFLTTSSVLAQNNLHNENGGQEVAYRFPIMPGSTQWKAIESYEEKVNACQIPDSILTQMSTKSLVLSCLSYPLILDVFAFNSIQVGFESVMYKFNGYQELIKRKDASLYLLELYSRKRIDGFDTSASSIEKGAHVFSFIYIELFLSQNEFIHELDISKKYELLKICSEFLANKQKHQIFEYFGSITTALIMCRIMNIEKFPPFLVEVSSNTDLNMFLNYGIVPKDKGIINKISTLVQSYLKK